MIKKIFKVILGIIVGFIVLAIIIQTLRFIGPYVAGIVIGMLNLSPDSEIIQDFKDAGNIITLIISVYAGVKVYKKITASKEKINTEIKNMKSDES